MAPQIAELLGKLEATNGKLAALDKELKAVNKGELRQHPWQGPLPPWWPPQLCSAPPSTCVLCLIAWRRPAARTKLEAEAQAHMRKHAGSHAGAGLQSADVQKEYVELKAQVAEKTAKLEGERDTLAAQLKARTGGLGLSG